MLFELAVLAGLLSLLVGSRIAYRLIAPDDISRDGYAHLTLIQDIREAGHRYPRHPSNVATGGTYQYPYLVHWVLSFLPSAAVFDVDRYFSAISDVLYTGIFVFLYLYGHLDLPSLALCYVLFISTPSFNRPDLTHGTGISGRKPGVIVATISFLMCAFFIETGQLEFVLAALFFGGLVCLTSKFALQALLFISIGLSLSVSPLAIVVPPGAIIVASLLSAGNYIGILRTHVRHSYNYATKYSSYENTRAGFFHFDVGTLVSRIRSRDLSKDDLRRLRQKWYIKLLINNPYVIPVCFVIYSYYTGTFSHPLADVYVPWIVTGIVVFALTTLPPLQFLGESERYLDFVFLPSALLLAQAFAVEATLVNLLILAALLVGVAILGAYIYSFEKLLTPDEAVESNLENLVTFLDSSGDETLVVQPFNRAREIAWKTGHRVVDFNMNDSSSQAVIDERDKLCPEQWGYVTTDIEWIEGQYDPVWVVFDKEKMLPIGLQPPNSEPDFENDYYEVYAFEELS
ncbi:hypothetical protein [Haloarchaeobius baliensis]|uniref:hypothetical protein n=1 Tax=Haloarchaeobius baliensis TaxID=1670458 RepID=UPI003F881382